MQCLTTPRKVKLLNINSAAKLIVPNYKGKFQARDFRNYNNRYNFFFFFFRIPGPFLDADLEFGTTTMERSKDKMVYTSSVTDTLSNLFSSSTSLNSNINTGMGFILGEL